MTRHDAVDPVDGIGARHQELHRTCPPELWDTVNEMFHIIHNKALKSVTVPWYLPLSLGGLGMFGVASNDDCRLAHGALCEWESLSRRPAPIIADTPWQVRKVAVRRIAHASQQLLDAQQVLKETRAVGILCAATLFDSRVAIGDLFSSIQEDAKDRMRINKRFWSMLRKGTTRKRPNYAALPAVTDWEEIVGRSAEESFTRSSFASPPHVGVVFGDTLKSQSFKITARNAFELTHEMSYAEYQDKAIELNIKTNVQALQRLVEETRLERLLHQSVSSPETAQSIQVRKAARGPVKRGDVRSDVAVASALVSETTILAHNLQHEEVIARARTFQRKRQWMGSARGWEELESVVVPDVVRTPDKQLAAHRARARAENVELRAQAQSDEVTLSAFDETRKRIAKSFERSSILSGLMDA